MDHLDGSWRPDRSGVLVEFVRDDLPWDYRGEVGVMLSIVAQARLIQWEPLTGYVTELIGADIPVFLSAA